MIVELHTSMRFAWLQENKADYLAVEQSFTNPLALIRKAYNAIFWIFLLPFFTLIDYGTGFILFTIIIFIRLGLNFYTNNFLDLSPEGYNRHPFRIP